MITENIDIKESENIFKDYYTFPNKFIDRINFKDSEDSIDVIIPLINTNTLFKRNLFNYYERIPINRLLIGDGGITDDSLEILSEFPRVKVFDHHNMKSQGGSIVDLIRNVETKEFIYLHADVFLPEDWYDAMKKNTSSFDWFECPQRLTVTLEYWNDEGNNSERAYSGAQMGDSDVMKKCSESIDDDYLQRNEDIILAELVSDHGKRYGRALNTFHYHQIANRRGEKEPNFARVLIEKETDLEWEIKINEMQYKGIIKYLSPNKKYLIKSVNQAIIRSIALNATSKSQVKNWVQETNPEWLPHLKFNHWSLKILLKNVLNKFR